MEQTKTPRKSKYFDFTMFVVVIFLVCFGLVMVYSTSYYNASLNENDGLYYLKRQLICVGIGAVAMAAATFFPYRFYRPLGQAAYVFSVLFSLLTLTPLKYGAKGAYRWIKILGFTVQVAEISKIGIILGVAALISMTPKENRKDTKLTLETVIVAGISAAILVFVTNDLSSAVILCGIAILMLIVAVPGNKKPYIVILAVAVAGLILFLAIINGWGNMGFRGERVLAWLDPEAYADGKGFQPLQAMYGIGSGGVWGKGLGKSVQKLGFLPEAHNDMIFSVVCEELGLVGGMSLIFLFCILLWRIWDIVDCTSNYYGKLLGTGVFCHIALQVVMNVAVVTGTMPNTGISLPFISYGGSSIICLLFEMGIVMNLARNIDFKESAARKINSRNRRNGRYKKNSRPVSVNVPDEGRVED